jgi:hypothetical protein
MIGGILIVLAILLLAVAALSAEQHAAHRHERESDARLGAIEDALEQMGPSS